MQGPVEEFPQDLYKTSSRLAKTLAKIFIPAPPRESYKIIMKGPAAAACRKHEFWYRPRV